jgi:putative SOS response-associated peptidase YedK
MCYDVAYVLDKKIKYARHRKDDPAYIEELTRKLEEWYRTRGPKYHASGFAHPELLVFTNDKPFEPQGFRWGLIPGWVKDWNSAKKLSIQTLNARGETIFEKPSFRNAAKNKRCLIYVDGFFEHHHYKGKTYPFRVAMKDDSPIALAGLWEEWVNQDTGEVIRTACIVTTDANEMMAKIHNNPKAEGPRMPVILPKEMQEAWLSPCKTELDKKYVQNLICPYPDEELVYHPVARLRGTEAIGNVPEASLPVTYEELADLI